MRGPVRLLLVVDSLEVGGAERHVVDLARALREKGYDATVASSAAGEFSEALEGTGIRFRPLLSRLVKRRVSVTYARRLRRLVRAERFDLVHAHIYASAAASALATLGTGVPLVVTEHTEGTWQGHGARLVSRLIYRRARRVIAVSSAIQRRLSERDGLSRERISLVPNAVTNTPGTRQDIPQALLDGWREGPLVGAVARLQPEKGIATLLKATARVSSSLPAARFVVVGDGPLREEMHLLAKRLGLRERVRFLGHCADARALIGLLDVLVVPSLTEGTPLTVLEAMAAGVPIVASAVGGIPDQVRHEEEGLLVPPDDTVALGDALLRLLRNPGHARCLGEAGRRRARSEFAHATMVQRIEAVYGAALGRPPAQGASREGPPSQVNA